MKRLNVLLLAGFAAACATTADFPAASNAAWIESWGASPVAPTPQGGFFGGSPAFENQTIRQVVRLSAGGSELRVRLTNEFGATPLKIGAATVALAGPDGAPMGAVVPLTFSGLTSATIPAQAPLLSDPVQLPTEALQSVSISLYLPEATGPCTCHFTAAATGQVSAAGDFTEAGTFESALMLAQRAFISGVDVTASGPASTIVAFGDSITDGVGATADKNDRWPDVLADRLVARGGAVTYGVSNQAISGNRLLADGADASGGLPLFGDSILARMDRDVLSVPGAKYVVLFIGVNDLGNALGPENGGGGFSLPKSEVTEATMIAGYRQVIARAHAHGIKVYGATITPYRGASTWTEEGEALRQAINTWIREGGEYDGVVDFDAAVRDPADPSQFAEGMHMGDWLHGSPAGYAAMAAAIDLSLFE
jgi:lysophospholipase L1-like esterase